MKLLLLKRKLYKAALLIGLGLASTITVSERTYCSAAVSTGAYKQFEQVFHTCLFDQSNKKPFSYFIYQVTALVNKYKNEIQQHMPAPVLERFIIDLHNGLRINRSIPNKKQAAVKIGLIFRKYNKYLPPSLQRTNVARFLAALRFRLSIPDNG